jgi:putative transcriptional regulator
MRFGASLLFIVLPWCEAGAAAQPGGAADLGPGSLLVASRDLGDPNFATSVVLLVRYDEDEEGVVGLVINRQTRVTISRALEGIKGSRGRTDYVYAGGPVGRSGLLALVRSRAKIENAERVFGDVKLLSHKVQLEKVLSGTAGPGTFRAYVGYAGWTVPQLKAEIELGAWHVFPPDADLVFDPNPDGLWLRLIRRTETQVAGFRIPDATALRAAAGGAASILGIAIRPDWP